VRRNVAALAGVPFLTLVVLHSQQAPTIRVPVRLVSVPTLVASKEGKYIPGLLATDFHLSDNGHEKAFTLDTYGASLSLAVAIEVDQNVRDYVPFISRVGNIIENAVAAEGGETALLTYNDEVAVAKSFENGELSAMLRKITPSGHGAKMVDAGMKAVELLATRDLSHSRVLLLIGQPVDDGSEGKVNELLVKAEEHNVQIYTLRLPLLNKAFVSDSFQLRGLPAQDWHGGYQASIELTRAIPALRHAARAADQNDPFSFLAIATAGLQLSFRKQDQLENDLIAMGDALRSRYLLSFVPESDSASYHRIEVTVNIPGATVYARPGYRPVP
jgi:VWFA-related protein